MLLLHPFQVVQYPYLSLSLYDSLGTTESSVIKLEREMSQEVSRGFLLKKPVRKRVALIAIDFVHVSEVVSG